MWQGSGTRTNKCLTARLDEKWWHTVPLCILLEVKHGQLRGKWQKSDPAPTPAGTSTWGQGRGGCVTFIRASLTRNVHGKPFLKHEGSWFLNAGLLLEVCCFFYVSKIHLTSILTPRKRNCNSQETSVCQNSRAACRRPAARMIFIPPFQSQARKQVYERLIPPYMAAVSSHFFQRLRFSLSSSTPSFPSI